MTSMYDKLLTQRERIPTRIFDQAEQASVAVAREIAQLIKDKAARGQHAVLGLATGSTPTRLYAELVRLHREEGVSFRNVVTFNLDEYFPMQRHELQSYWRYMHEHLFNHIDIDPVAGIQTLTLVSTIPTPAALPAGLGLLAAVPFFRRR